MEEIQLFYRKSTLNNKTKRMNTQYLAVLANQVSIAWKETQNSTIK